MKNTIIKYKTEELDDYIVSDYFSKDVYVYEIIHELSSFLQLYMVDDNDTLENISYNLYGAANYWDILLLINNRDPLFEMPFNYDTLDSARNKMLDDFSNIFVNLSEDKRKEFSESFLTSLLEANETYRYIYVIKKQNIKDAFAILKQKGYL